MRNPDHFRHFFAGPSSLGNGSQDGFLLILDGAVVFDPHLGCGAFVSVAEPGHLRAVVNGDPVRWLRGWNRYRDQAGTGDAVLGSLQK